MTASLVFDPEARTLTGPLGERILSPQRATILAQLLLANRAVVSNNQLIGALYPNPDDEPENPDRIVRMGVHHLRKLCAEVGLPPKVIRNRWSTGYILDCDGELMTAESVPILKDLLASHPDREMVRRFRSTVRVHA